LSICHRVVTEHGGRIYAQSESGKGATFVVELPAGVEVASPVPDEELWIQIK
jgi:signal transduction histidine kinase